MHKNKKAELVAEPPAAGWASKLDLPVRSGMDREYGIPSPCARRRRPSRASLSAGTIEIARPVNAEAAKPGQLLGFCSVFIACAGSLEKGATP